jgi:hypothetical protein
MTRDDFDLWEAELELARADAWAEVERATEGLEDWGSWI